MLAEVRSVHATALTWEMCAVRRTVSSNPVRNHGHKRENEIPSSVLVLRLLEQEIL